MLLNYKVYEIKYHYFKKCNKLKRCDKLIPILHILEAPWLTYDTDTCHAIFKLEIINIIIIIMQVPTLRSGPILTCHIWSDCVTMAIHQHPAHRYVHGCYSIVLCTFCHFNWDAMHTASVHMRVHVLYSCAFLSLSLVGLV